MLNSPFFWLVFYVVSFLSIGIWATKRKGNVGTLDEFTYSSAGLGLILVIGTTMSVWFGGGIGFGAAEAAYREGFIPALRWVIGCSLGLLVAGLVMAKRMRELNLKTLGDFIIGRYQAPVKEGQVNSEWMRKFTVVCILIFSIMPAWFWAATHFSAMATMIEVIMPGMSYAALVWVMAIITLAYTYWGGLTSVTYTDLVQAIFIMVAYVVAVVYILVFNPVGTALANAATVDPKSIAITSSGLQILITNILAFIFLIPVDPHSVVRYNASKSSYTARNSFLWSALLVAIVGIVPPLLGIYGKAYFADVIKTNSAITFASVIIHLLPAWAASMMLVGLLSAAMSCVSGNFHVSGTTFGVNLYKQIFKPEAPDQSAVRIGRLFIVIHGLYAATFATFLKSPAVLSMLAFWTGAYIFAPVFIGLFWKRGNLHGAFYSMIVGIIFVLTALFYKPIFPYRGWLTAIGVIVGSIVYVLFSSIYSHLYKDIDYFEGRLFKRAAGNKHGVSGSSV